MKKILVAGLALAAMALAAEPKITQKQAEAYQAITAAQDPEARIKAAEAFINKFAESPLRGLVFHLAAEAASMKNDDARMTVFAEKSIEADPKNVMSRILLAKQIAGKTREHDFDKNEKLKQAETLAKDALANVPTAVKFFPNIPDDQWAQQKKSWTSEGNEALGLIANAKKMPNDAIMYFKAAVENSPTPDPVLKVRLVAADNDAGKFEDALALLDEVYKDPQLDPQVKKFADQQKLRAAMGKAAKK